MILIESKRDDLLLPYLEILKSKGIEMPLGVFKGAMLKKLADEGGMRNLSLSSNYYLAGAVKYYFQGLLTQNKDLSIFTDVNKRDIWNEDICKRLNACIEVLRNAYIDTIGTQFEQPEDFGKLSLPRLLRKYNKKIMAILGSGEDENTTQQEENRYVNSGPIGTNGYSFEIIYSYDQCTKYERATAPGSWCITYGQCHYNGYIRRLNIHYVIFLKDGYQNVKRKMGANFNPNKPHDEYGNSMIALLQSNANGEPVYITSRWNHGANDTPRIEADHAYTKEEFLNVVGITNDDLKRIFETWRHNATGAESSKPRGIDRTKKTSIIRSLKYIQMRINGGENPENLVSVYRKFSSEEAPLSKNVAFCKFTFEEDDYYFLMDKGRVIFETLTNEANAFSRGKTCQTVINNLLLLQYENCGFVYDIRMHNFVSVQEVKKFKKIPIIDDRTLKNQESFTYFTVKLDSNTIALLSFSTRKPLQLPNREFWFNRINTYTMQSYDHDLSCYVFSKNWGHILEIVYDMSSGEKYFFDANKKQFFSPPENPGISGLYNHDPLTLTVPTLGNICDENIYSIRYTTRDGGRSYWYASAEIVFDSNTHEQISLGKYQFIRDIDNVSNDNSFTKNIYVFKPCSKDARYVLRDEDLYLIYNFTQKKVYNIEVLHNRKVFDNGNCIAFQSEDIHRYISGLYCFIFDCTRNSFVENIVTEHPNRKQFCISRHLEAGGMPCAFTSDRYDDERFWGSWRWTDVEKKNIIEQAIREGVIKTVNYKELPLINF